MGQKHKDTLTCPFGYIIIIIDSDMEVNKHSNSVDKGPENESFHIPNLMCLSVAFI